MSPIDEKALKEELNQIHRGFIAHCNSIAEEIQGDKTSAEEGTIIALVRAQLASNVRAYGHLVAEASEFYEVGIPIHLEVGSSVATHDVLHEGQVVFPKGTAAEEVRICWHDEHLPANDRDQMVAKIVVMQQEVKLDQRWNGRRHMTDLIQENRSKGIEAILGDRDSAGMRAMTALGETHLLLGERVYPRPVQLEAGQLIQMAAYDGWCTQGGFTHEPLKDIFIITGHVFLQQRIERLAKQAARKVN